MIAYCLMPLLLAQSPQSPLVNSERYSSEKQWQALEASPRVEVVKLGDGAAAREYVDETGSAVIVAVKDGYAYALTASHVIKIPDRRIDLAFFNRSSYPGAAYTLRDAKIVDRVSSPDLALLKVKLNPGDPVPPVLKLVAPGERPKRFSFPVLTVGSDGGFSARCAENLVIHRKFIRRSDEFPAYFWESQYVSAKGRSGGPMLNSNLSVLGICSANDGGLGYFAHTDEIHAWLKQLGYSWIWKP